MKNILIVPNVNKDRALETTRLAIEALEKAGARVFAESKYKDQLKDACVVCDAVPEETELVLVVGGDGSVLDASVIALERDIPILGINLGRVGYLSEIEPGDISSLSKLVSGDYFINERMLLECSVDGAELGAAPKRLAVNDVVISHNSYLGISEFSVASAQVGLKYRADGIIFATPAGSTAYSFSAGGPVVLPGVNTILATPVCPHSFFDRSILFSGDDMITVKNTGHTELYVSVDGRSIGALAPDGECIVRKSKKKIKMLTLNCADSLSTFFKKVRVTEDLK